MMANRKPKKEVRLSTLSALNMLYTAQKGWAIRPVNASVTAKQAKMMFALVCSVGLLFMAIITEMFSNTVKGQDTQFVVATMMYKISSDVSSDVPVIGEVEVLSPMIVKFEAEMFTILKRKK